MISSLYKLPYKKHIEPKRKSDLLIAYEKTNNRKQPLNVVYLTKEKISKDMSEDDIEKLERETASINLDDEKNKFEVVPIVKPTELNTVSFFVSASSGSGKSYFVAGLVNTIRTLDRFKEAEVFLITGQQKADPAYEDQIEHYLKINMDSDEFFTLKYQDFENSIVIFDDVNSLGNRYLESFVFNLQKSLAENGRKNNIALININHSSRDFQRTKYIIHESMYYTLFPSHNWNDTKKFLKSYLDYDENQMKDIKRLSRHTRAMTFHKQVPQYIVADHMIKLV